MRPARVELKGVFRAGQDGGLVKLQLCADRLIKIEGVEEERQRMS